jgi:hypothetical protein
VSRLALLVAPIHQANLPGYVVSQLLMLADGSQNQYHMHHTLLHWLGSLTMVASLSVMETTSHPTVAVKTAIGSSKLQGASRCLNVHLTFRPLI